MTDKEFRRLSRADLIEIIYELQQSEKALQEEIAELKRQLADRRAAVSKVGSLAELSAALNGLFEAAQATADEYLKEIEKARKQADEYLAGTKMKASDLASHMAKERREMLARTEAECERQREAVKRGERPKQQIEDPRLQALLKTASKEQDNGSKKS